jgi:hypothetical protein
MKRIILIVVFALPLFLGNPSTGQSKEALKSILANSWVKKYKKLKKDLEEKASFVKNMKNISESDLKIMETSYSKTSERLDAWLLHFAESIENDEKTITYLNEGSISPELKTELVGIFTYYANEYSTKFEDLTGIQTKTLITHQVLNGEEKSEDNSKIEMPTNGKIDKNYLLANVIKPLKPSAWNSIF